MLIKGKTLQNATALKEYKIKEGDKVTPSKGVGGLWKVGGVLKCISSSKKYF